MWSDTGVSMAVSAYALPRRLQFVVVILGLVATVLVLLLAFRILTGPAYWAGSSVAIALIVLVALCSFDGMPKRSDSDRAEFGSLPRKPPCIFVEPFLSGSKTSRLQSG